MMDINPQLAELKNIVVDLSKDMNYIKGELSQMNERLQSLEGRMTTLEGRMTDLFKWQVGMMIPVWIGILGAILIQLLK